MKVYLTKSGTYLRTQAEAKKSGEEWNQVEVPTDSKGLIAYLNGLQKVDVNPSPPPPPPPKQSMGTALEILSEMDDGKQSVNTAVEAIGRAGMYALARYASAVAIRFEEISNAKKRK